MVNLPTDWRSAYEAFALFVIGRGGSLTCIAGWIVFLTVVFTTRSQTIFGLRIGLVMFGWIGLFLGLNVVGGLIGWNEIAERHRLKGKLKPIPARGNKIELYEIETGKVVGHISQAELTYLIESFAEWGMADNDFYIMRETVDLFEERSADAHLVATLRQIMGTKNDMEIGWTLV